MLIDQALSKKKNNTPANPANLQTNTNSQDSATNVSAIEKYRTTFPDIHKELRRLGYSRQKRIIEILDSNLSPGELTNKLTEEQKFNDSLKERLQTAKGRDYNMLSGDIFESNVALEALKAKLSGNQGNTNSN